jgi:hypothetical protein
MRDAAFIMGANLPWLRYGCDFGSNRWQPDGGLASNGSAAAARDALDRLADLGVSVVRWFVFCDGRAGIGFDTRDLPRGVDDATWADLDLALELARARGLRLLLSLLDFHWCRPARWSDGVRLGGRCGVLRSAGGRAALLDRVLAPTVSRYAGESTVFAWEVMNEPEWVTLGLGGWRPRHTLRRGTMRTFLGEAARAVGSASRRPVTVGLASARWLSLVRGLDLDFYQVHWYDRLERHAPLSTTVERLRLDRPVVLGEFPTRGSTRGVAAVLDAARRAGYSGALFWSWLAGDRATDAAAAERALLARLERPLVRA